MNTTAATRSATAAPAQTTATSPPVSDTPSLRYGSLTAHTLLLFWIVVQSWSDTAIRAAMTRTTGTQEERERGEALSTVAIAVGMVIIAGLILTALKVKSQTIVSNVCTNADPSSC